MRYAIYFTPAPDAALWRFGSSVLGYDSRARAAVGFPQHSLWLEPWFLRLQETPARYGFHATLKAPFELAEGVRERALLERAAVFSGVCAPLCLPALEVALLDDFIALRPLSEDAELNRLAATCVREFDHLRAPLGAEDRARRLSQVLTPRQHAHLDRWAAGLYEGMEVRSGDLLGYVGNTGNAKRTPSHLHFAVNDNDEMVNPYPILTKAAVVKRARVAVEGSGAALGTR